MDARTLEVKFMFLPGEKGSKVARQELLARARKKIYADVDRAGFAPIADTYRVEWSDARNGVAILSARKR